MSWHTNRETGKKFTTSGRGIDSGTFKRVSDQDKRRFQSKVANDHLMKKIKAEKENVKELTKDINDLFRILNTHKNGTLHLSQKIRHLESRAEDIVVNEFSTVGSIESVATKARLESVAKTIDRVNAHIEEARKEYLSAIGSLADLRDALKDAELAREVGMAIKEENSR